MEQPEHNILIQMLDQLSSGICLLEQVEDNPLQFRFSYANQHIEPIIKLSKEELIDYTLFEVFPQTYLGPANLPNALAKALQSGQKIVLDRELYGDMDNQIIMYDAYCQPLAGNSVMMVVDKVDAFEEVLSNDQDLLKILLAQGEKTAKQCSWIVEPASGYSLFSKAYFDIHHFDAGEVTAFDATAKCIELIHPDDQAKMQAFRERENRSYPDSEYYRFQIPNGSYIWLEDSIAQEMDDGRILGITRDITTNREREVLLEELNRKLETLNLELEKNQHFQHAVLESNPTIISLIDAETQEILYSNGSSYSILGYTQAEIEQMSSAQQMELIHPEDRAKVVNFYRNLPKLKAGEKKHLLRRNIHKDGAIRWLAASYLVFETDENANAKSVIGFLMDITEVKEAEIKLQELNEQLAVTSEELQASNEELISYTTRLDEKSAKLETARRFQNKVMETSPEIIYVYDLVERRNVFSNKSLFNELGYSDEEVQALGSQLFLKTIHPEDLETVFQHHGNTLPKLEEKEVTKLVYRMFSKNSNHYAWLESTESVFERDEKGQVRSIIGIARNISREKQTELQLRESQEELEKFVYSVSHDLRAPVRHIEAFTERVIEMSGDELSEDNQALMARVALSSKRLGSMIDGLLTYSRNSKAKPKIGAISTQQLVADIIDALSRTYPNRNIEWEIGELADCQADQEMLKQVWENLIDNAVKYTGKKSIAKIEIKCEPHPHEVIYSIKDNGAGFNPKYADKLFTFFQRLHTRSEFPGNGIGLANVKRIISAHQGQLWAESKIDEGAVFYFSIPILIYGEA